MAPISDTQALVWCHPVCEVDPLGFATARGMILWFALALLSHDHRRSRRTAQEQNVWRMANDGAPFLFCN